MFLSESVKPLKDMPAFHFQKQFQAFHAFIFLSLKQNLFILFPVTTQFVLYTGLLWVN